MKRIPQAIYRTAAGIDESIRQLEFDATQFRPDTNEHRELMKQIAQLRICADARRWLAGPTKQHA